jgi:hypothetical protein
MPINSTDRGIDWNEANTEKKLEFLYGWCENLESMLNRRGAKI